VVHTGQQLSAHLFDEALVALLLHFRGAGQRHFAHRLARVRLDLVHAAALARGEQRNGDALLARPAGAPDAVHVILGVRRHVVVEHMRNIRNVQSAGGHIGGYHQRHAAVAEAVEHQLAARLVQVAVQRVRREAPAQQFIRQVLCPGLGACEDQPARHLVGLQQAAQRRQFSFFAHAVKALFGFGHGDLPGVDADPRRITHVLRRQLLYLRRQGG